jgi:hypothetical protein
MGAAAEFGVRPSPRSRHLQRVRHLEHVLRSTRRPSNTPAIVDASFRAIETWIASQQLQCYVAKMIGIAISRSGQVDNALGDDLLDDVRLPWKRSARLVESSPHGSSPIGAEEHVLREGNNDRHWLHSSFARAQPHARLAVPAPGTTADALLILLHFPLIGDYAITTSTPLPGRASAPISPSPKGESPPRVGGYLGDPSCGRDGPRPCAR